MPNISKINRLRFGLIMSILFIIINIKNIVDAVNDDITWKLVASIISTILFLGFVIFASYQMKRVRSEGDK